jgi:uncharacterized damage-inducible protein DinB
MPMNASFIAEINHEAATTRKFFERYPEGKQGWTPHEKSMKIEVLAGHIAEIPTWVGFTLDQDVLDFATLNYKPIIAENRESLLAIYDKNVADAIACFERAGDDVFMQNWTMRNGEQVYFTMPKIAVLRTFVFNHNVHHRAQLGVYYRLLDIAVPGSYGPTADEKNM